MPSIGWIVQRRVGSFVGWAVLTLQSSGWPATIPTSTRLPRDYVGRTAPTLDDASRPHQGFVADLFGVMQAKAPNTPKSAGLVVRREEMPA